MIFPFENNSMFLVFIVGLGFGFFLEVAGMGSPRKLTAQFTLRDWSVFKVMFVAIIVAATGLWFFELLGLLNGEALKVQKTFFWAMALGGALLGAGMAIGGYCPGTSVVGLFSGRLDALVFMIGILIGTVLFAENFNALEHLYRAANDSAAQTLPQLTGLSKGMILLLLMGVAVLGYRLGERFERRHEGVITAKDLQ